MRVPDAAFGKRIKCPGCKTVIPVPDLSDLGDASRKAVPSEPEPQDDLAHLGKAPGKPAREGGDGDENDRPRGKGRSRARATVSPGGPVSEADKSQAFQFYLILLVGNLVALGVPAALVFWFLKRGRSKFVDHTGKQWINHAITLFGISLATVLVFGTLGLLGFFVLESWIVGVIGLVLMIVSLVGLGLLELVLLLRAMFAVKAGEWSRHPLTWQLLK
jgi:uncharacterized Tic20 family protein